MIKNNNKKLFKKCKKCSAWSGIDCTRNPYTEGCLDEMDVLKNKIKEALNHFLNEVSCEDCSYYKELSNSIESTVNLIIDTLLDDTSNLINEYEKEIKRLKAENARLTTKLGQVLLSIDTVKEMNTMCSIYEQRKQAKTDVLNELKKKIHYTRLNDDTAEIIIEMIEELQNAEDNS